MTTLSIQDHSEALRWLDSPPGKFECKKLVDIWTRYEPVPQWAENCFCFRADREAFLAEFAVWFATATNNLEND